MTSLKKIVTWFLLRKGTNRRESNKRCVIYFTLKNFVSLWIAFNSSFHSTSSNLFSLFIFYQIKLVSQPSRRAAYVRTYVLSGIGREISIGEEEEEVKENNRKALENLIKRIWVRERERKSFTQINFSS